jgi:hypothetical protein
LKAGKRKRYKNLDEYSTPHDKREENESKKCDTYALKIRLKEVHLRKMVNKETK